MNVTRTTRNAGHLQNARPVKILRSEIDTDDFNPREITDENRRRLKESLKTFGLLGAPIYNVRTHHVVGGHQRLGALDSLMGRSDYELDVIQVDLSEKDEARLNVALNNPDLQGTYNFAAIDSLCKEFDLDPVNDCFFSPEMAAVEFPDFSSADSGFGSAPKKEVSDEEAEEYRKARRDRAEKHRKHDAEVGNYNIAEMKGVITVVFKNESEKRMFLSSHAYPEDKTAISFNELKEIITENRI